MCGSYQHKRGKADQAISFRGVTMCLLSAGFLLVLAAPGFSQSPDEFNPGANNPVYAIAVQTDGKILVGGNFNTLAGQPRSRLGRLNPDGTLDASFDPAPNGFIETLVVQPDGKILVGGSFSTICGQSRWGIARLGAAGTLDEAFDPRVEGAALGSIVHALALQPDGKILVGGSFVKIGGQWRTNLARLNPDGTVDNSFNPQAGPSLAGFSHVLSVVLQPDGKILAGGWFGNLAGKPRHGFGRLNQDGTLDIAFDPQCSGYVYAIAVQADGQILVGGSFGTIGGQPRTNLARLGTNGIADATFNPGASGIVHSIGLQADGKILVSGSFSNLANSARTNIGRLNQDGTLDTAFDPSADGRALAVTLQPDGKILVGGEFTALGGVPRSRIGRLNNPDAATQNLVFDSSVLTWMRGGSAPEVWHTQFDFSTNGMDWTFLGPGTRIPGGWQSGPVLLPREWIVRARGFVVSGEWSGSSWFVEDTMHVSQVPPTILVHDGNFGFRSNRFGFSLAGNPGQGVIVEASPNLVDWIALTTNTIGATPWYFSDPGSESFPHRFYRARLR